MKDSEKNRQQLSDEPQRAPPDRMLQGVFDPVSGQNITGDYIQASHEDLKDSMSELLTEIRDRIVARGMDSTNNENSGGNDEMRNDPLPNNRINVDIISDNEIIQNSNTTALSQNLVMERKR